jgi:hypothetical protein
MPTYNINYWAEHRDEPTDFNEEIEADSPEQAIINLKSSSRTARRGKYHKSTLIKY